MFEVSRYSIYCLGKYSVNITNSNVCIQGVEGGGGVRIKTQ